MDPNQKTEQKRVVVDTPGVRREVVTERTQRGPTESGISTGMIAVIAIVTIAAIGIIVYVVSNRNVNESANRNANLEMAGQANTQPATTIIQQPAAPAQQAPVIIQQPAQQAPVIIQQPVSGPVENSSATADASMQDVAARKLIEDPDMGSISVTVSEARAVLTGNANSEATKARAERLVKEVRGVRSVDNKIFVPGD
jgi:hypothetical protein